MSADRSKSWSTYFCARRPVLRRSKVRWPGLLAIAALSVTPALALAAETGDAADSQHHAATLLKDMTTHLAKLQGFSVVFRAGYDVVQPSGQKIEFGETRRLTLARPDRLWVEEVSSDGKRDLAVFDGRNISVLDADAGVYAQAPQPGGLDDALAYFVRELRIRMPLGLLLTQDLSSTLPGRVQSIDYVESTEILGVMAHHIAGRTANVDFQFWIRQGAEPLPVRVVITYVQSPGQPQFWANLVEWNTRPAIGPATFVFTPPQGARKIPFAVQVPPPSAPPPPMPADDGSAKATTNPKEGTP